MPDIVKGGPPGRRACEEMIRPWGMAASELWSAGAMGVMVVPPSRVMGRSIGASVI